MKLTHLDQLIAVVVIFVSFSHPVKLQAQENLPSEELEGSTSLTKEPANTKETLITEPDEDVQDGKKICKCRFPNGASYAERRPLVSGFFGLMAGLYTPSNYMPNYATNQTYAQYYGSQQNPNAEVLFGAKLNFFLGSIGPHITAGFFSAQNSPLSAKLNVSPVTVGLIYELDNIFKEPYVVPYVIGGGYEDFYTETVGPLSVTGTTPFAMFYSVGLMFQLDWIDSETHATGYEDFGLQNTFLFIEGRSFLQSSEPIADFSTPLQFNGGLRFEF